MTLDNCNSYSIRIINGEFHCHLSEEGPLTSPPKDVDYGVYFFRKGKINFLKIYLQNFEPRIDQMFL